MAEAKTRPTGESVASFINAVPDETRRRDAKALLKLFKEVTGEKPELWGASIVGFGRYVATYANGKTAEWMRTGFSPRKGDMVVYAMPGFEDHDALLKRMGKHKTGKSCLYLKSLADLDMAALRDFVAASYAEMARRYPK